jgi:hypothetical protein
MASIAQSEPPAWARCAHALLRKFGEQLGPGYSLDGPDGVIYPEVTQVLPTMIEVDITPAAAAANGSGKKRLLRLTATCIEK